jgi:hypothetical protein
MLTSNFSDHDMELLFSGARPENDELAELTVFVDLIRIEGSHTPSVTVVAWVATEAAKIARSTLSPNASTSALLQRRWAGKRLRPQLAAAAAVLLLFGTTGVAVAADGAAPGHLLYEIDRALEQIGIGAGGVQERVDEASVLLSEGNARQALAHAAQAFDETEDSGEEIADLEQARAALVEAAKKLPETDQGDASELLVLENVSALLDYLKANLGKQVGADGKTFGQGVADLARGITSGDDTADPSGEDGADPSQDVGEDKAKKGDKVGGPPDAAPGNENDTGSGNENSGGGENGNSGGGENGNGPPDGSPSETAPGQTKKP